MKVIDSTVKALCTYLSNKLPSEITIIKKFPTGMNNSLVYPTLSIVAGKIQIELIRPDLISWVDISETIKVDSLYKIGNVGIPFQLDLWCMSDPQRQSYTDLLVETLTFNGGRSDLNLVRTDYYNTAAHLQIEDGPQFSTTSNEVMVSEYRTNIHLGCESDLLVTKEEYKFIHIFLHSKVFVQDDNIPETITKIF